ncbi:MAG TPA: PduL/EutD family phosphate acyltransferase [Gemmatimonadales bacterium]
MSPTLPIGVSNRHLHLSPADVARLLGPGATLTLDRAITQPGQFAARERINVIGPKGRIDGVRIVGPARIATQVELALTDCRALGVAAQVANSGHLGGSVGGVTLEGPGGSVRLDAGVIVAARHLHCAPADARRLALADGDWIRVGCGAGSRRVTFDDLLVRAGPTHATEVHLDSDEAFAAAVRTGDRADLVAVRRAGATVWEPR